jgi:cytochrome c oxidase accessory protein FixG
MSEDSSEESSKQSGGQAEDGARNVDLIRGVRRGIVERTEAVDWAGGKPTLFEKRIKVFPRRVKGRFRSMKWGFLLPLLTIYYFTPWIRWDRGPFAPDQAVLIDLSAGRFYFFWIEIWPQEIYYLAGLMIMAAVGLFLFTALFGRVWCAWGCPQTVWTDFFMWVERKVEGDRNARIKLDKAPWGGEKIAKRGLKHLLWILIAADTGGAWIFYFADAPTLGWQLLYLTAPPAAWWTIGILTLTTYLLAGHAREQVCTYMCPYSRFQSVMLDDESVIITYRADRGETRGSHKRGESWEGRGHCVDCTLCVAVCPTGIDIRNGPQVECINCGLCADACNSVMSRVGLPRGLIGLDSLANVERRKNNQPERIKFFRPRILFYAALLVIMAAIMTLSLTSRPLLDVNLARDRNPLFVTLSSGDIRNGYTIKILNKLREYVRYELRVEGVEGATITVVGEAPEANGRYSLQAPPDGLASFRVFVAAPKASLSDPATTLTFILEDATRGISDTHDTTFRGPGK